MRKPTTATLTFPGLTEDIQTAKKAQTEPPVTVEQLIAERDVKYGSAWLRTGNTLATLNDEGVLDQILSSRYGFAYIMLLNKADRLLTDPSNVDGWTDIAGYATLVKNDIEGK